MDGICAAAPLVEIRSLGGFAVTIGGEPLAFARKTPRKPLSLLKAIVALGRPAVCEHRLTDALWPDAEADAAHQAFSMALHRLRKLLGRHDAVVLRDGRVCLDRHLCWVDACALERLAAEADHHPERDPAQTLRQALALYRGDFLADDDEPWVFAPRERLRDRFERLVSHQAGRLEAAGRQQEAAHFLHLADEAAAGARGLSVSDPLATLP